MIIINEPAHDKPCATREDSDQPAHSRSLIRVFADRMCLPQSQGHSKRYEREPVPCWMDVQADISLCWLHISSLVQLFIYNETDIMVILRASSISNYCH